MLGEADAVAEQRAVTERGGGVDGQHADGTPSLASSPRQRADQRRLAGARRPGETDDRGVAGVRVYLLTSAQPSGRSSSTSEIARASARRSPSSKRFASVEPGIASGIIAGRRGPAGEDDSAGDGTAAADHADAARSAEIARPPCAGRPRRCMAVRWRWSASCAPTTCSASPTLRLLVR